MSPANDKKLVWASAELVCKAECPYCGAYKDLAETFPLEDLRKIARLCSVHVHCIHCDNEYAVKVKVNV